jgi:hypothetical protein
MVSERQILFGMVVYCYSLRHGEMQYLDFDFKICFSSEFKFKLRKGNIKKALKSLNNAIKVLVSL